MYIIWQFWLTCFWVGVTLRWDGLCDHHSSHTKTHCILLHSSALCIAFMGTFDFILLQKSPALWFHRIYVDTSEISTHTMLVSSIFFYFPLFSGRQSQEYNRPSSLFCAAARFFFFGEHKENPFHERKGVGDAEKRGKTNNLLLSFQLILLS